MTSWRQIHWPSPLDANQAVGFLTALASDTTRSGLTFEARTEAGKTSYLVGAEDGEVQSTVSLLRRLFPGAVLTELSHARTEVERAGRLHIRQRNLNLALDASPETLRTVLAALTHATGKGDVLVLQVVLGRALAPELLHPHSPDPTASLARVLLTGSTPPPSDVRGRLQQKLAQYRFRAVVRVGVASPSPVRRRLMVHAILAALRTLQSSGTTISLTSKNPVNLDSATVPLRQPLRLTPGELLPLLAWPVGAENLPGLPPAHPRLIAPPNTYKAPADRVFAMTTSPGGPAPVGIDIADATRHTHLYGPTGAGKSTLLQHLIAADLRAGRSVVVIDPKRDLAMDVLTLIPENRVSEVAIIDPSLARPTGINPFAGFDQPNADERRSLVADIMLDLFRGLFPTAFGPQTSDTLHVSFLTLTYAPDASLARLPQLLTDPNYRRGVVSRITDPALQGFWAQYDAKSPGQQAAAVGPAMSRLRQFLLRPGVRAVLEQANPNFELSDLFTKRRILIVSLNKGMLGTAASLIGALVVAQLWQLILARAATPPAKRRPVSIYIDEAQNFLHLGDLAEALEQSRSLGAAWHLAHQHRAQMPDKLLRAIDANARNKIIFGLEDDEARAAARLTGLDAEDFTRLPPYEIYTSLQHHGRRTGWFSARVLPPLKAVSSADAVIAEAESRFGACVETPPPVQIGLFPDANEPIGRTKRSHK
ncbi:type IV secretion system DNA-binding domain-containing protein [Microbacterium sp. cx-55]|uniref:type IV secretory system conjugative DNA transfer family protein n=1 Tax=Microbacterium sp. cx-55 TaxID=2875948 RepID=UPI001CC12BF2|nr:DUF87 domain-containing protein [Microbacterium sp. cx-55]MBZ4488112.1 type IV secretion system DNA-binding domain-containing protein [Microbacterium sp. cx-55]UGB34479.1 type IV secretion system DNA-binding domain-containing protein [Microbacterium sp. cx-55]